MKILILGSEGFIGRNCISYYLNAGEEVYGADLFEQPSQGYNYTKISRLSPELDELISTTRFNAIINAAGSGNVPYSMTHPLADFEANCLDTIRLLETLRRHNPACRYLHISSAAVYGNPLSIPVTERDRIRPLSPYGFHKMIAEELCREYTELYTIPTAIARPFSVYGPGLQKQMFWDIYKKTQATTETITLHGTGKESRDYIFIHDLVEALNQILTNGSMEAEVYNLASGIETTIEDAVRIYFDALNIQPRYTFNGQVRPGDPLNWCADISNLKSLGFTNSTSLQDGLNKVAQWIKSVN